MYALNEYADECISKHIKTIHNKTGSKSWITIANKEKEYTQRHYTYSQLLINADHIIGGINTYISMNAFWSTYRRTEYLKQLNTLYIDLDIYNTAYTKEQVLMALKEEYFGTKIPTPNMIMDSGRGLYLIWTLKKTPNNALPLWNGIENYLYEQLKQFGADRKALDCTRVLRVPGTINSKSNTEVRVLEEYPFEYELRDIQREYLPELSPKEISKKRKGRKPKLISLYTTHSLHYARTKDIIKLCELRQWDLRGHREDILFLYRMFSLCFTQDKEKALQDALELNSQFIYPLRENEVKRATRSAEKKEYKYKNSTLIEKLDITQEEEQHLKTIISNRERNNRKKEANKELRRNEKGLTKREQQKQDTTNKVLALKEKGLNNTQIAEKLGISTRYVRKILNS